MRSASAGVPRSSSFSPTWFRERIAAIFLPRLGLHRLAAQRATRTLSGRLALAPHRAAIDEDVLDPGRRGRRHFEGRAVGDGLGIEDGDVGIPAGRENASAGKTEAIGG